MQNYTDYELSDEHMRGTIHGAHPSLDPIRKAHFDAWLAAHDRRVLESGLSKLASSGVVTITGKGGALQRIKEK